MSNNEGYGGNTTGRECVVLIREITHSLPVVFRLLYSDILTYENQRHLPQMNLTFADPNRKLYLHARRRKKEKKGKLQKCLGRGPQNHLDRALAARGRQHFDAYLAAGGDGFAGFDKIHW